MICPKCGYEQENRLDCLKCGIVFNKYLALHAGGKTGRADAGVFPQPTENASEESPSPEILNLQQNLREMQRRVSEVEFERAERNLMKNEIKALEQRIQNLFDPAAARLTELESRLVMLEHTPPTPSREDLNQLKKQIEEDIASNQRSLLGDLQSLESKLTSREPERLTHVSDRVNALEGGMQGVNEEAKQVAVRLGAMEPLLGAHAEEVPSLKRDISSLAAAIEALREAMIAWSGRIADLEKCIAKLQVQVLDVEGQCKEKREALHHPEDQGIRHNLLIEDDIHAIREDLDQIRQFTVILMKKL